MKNIKKYSYIRENSLVKDIFIVSSVSDLYKYLDFNFAPIGNMSKTICGYNLFNINIIKSNIKCLYLRDISQPEIKSKYVKEVHNWGEIYRYIKTMDWSDMK